MGLEASINKPSKLNKRRKKKKEKKKVNSCAYPKKKTKINK